MTFSPACFASWMAARTDRPARPVNEHGFAGARLAAPEQSDMGRRVRHPEGRTRCKTHARGQPHHIAGAALDLLGVTSRSDWRRARRRSTTGSPTLEFRRRRHAERGHHASGVTTRDIGKRRTNRVGAASHISVGRVDPGGTHIDDDLARARAWDRRRRPAAGRPARRTNVRGWLSRSLSRMLPIDTAAMFGRVAETRQRAAGIRAA